MFGSIRTFRRRAFTLIELIAVVVVLAILAGVALPKFLNYAAQAKSSSCKGALAIVRSGIANYRTNAAARGETEFPSLAQLELTHAVLVESIPENPYNGSNDVVAARWNAVAPPVNGAAGWNYDPLTGKFWANSNTAGENGF
ncbi:MAG TPA: type II secretion system protein [Phycisphaerales bacterium]|nr:type II secretion system protein [Phycisphaerales bacterium]